MAADLTKIDLLVRREIEARIGVPLIKAFMKELGKEKTLQIARRVIKDVARESGLQLSKLTGGNSIADLTKGLDLWTKGDALRIEVLEQSEGSVSFNVTRCRYAEMYREAGMLEFGDLLSCGRDFAMIEGFNARMKLTRTQTIMDGKDCCDFRIIIKEG